jgi:hypothetical protein
MQCRAREMALNGGIVRGIALTRSMYAVISFSDFGRPLIPLVGVHAILLDQIDILSHSCPVVMTGVRPSAFHRSMG